MIVPWPAIARTSVRRRVTGTLLSILALASLWLDVPAAPPPTAMAASPAYRVERGLNLPVVGEAAVALSGSLLVWEETGADGLGRVLGLDLRTNRRLPLPVAAGSQRQPAISGMLATWLEQDPATRLAHVIVYDLDTHQRTVASGPEAVPQSPAIDGATVVWRDRRGGRTSLFGRDLVDGNEFLVASGALDYGPPAISGGAIVWEEFNGASWDVQLHDRATGQTRVLAGGPDDQVAPRIAGPWVVFEQRAAVGGVPALRLTSVAGGTPITVTDQHFVTAASIAPGQIVWEDWRDGVAGIFVYDIERRVEQALTRSEQARRPVVNGSVVVWVNQSLTGSLLSVATLRPILPTERREAPLQPDPQVIYFPETGHTIGYGFKSFWQQHGGVPVFGYPLTDEFVEAATGGAGTRVVQYYERLKLAYDAREPDPAKQVTIARLGADWLDGRLPARIDGARDTAAVRYFPETGHTLGGGFKAYWEEIDGLRLLGYPITEEMTEAAFTVQYFERGQLIYDASQPPSARISIGLLGRTVLAARGWLPGLVDGAQGRPDRPR